MNLNTSDVLKNEFGDFSDFIEFENNQMGLDFGVISQVDFDQCQEYGFNTEFADGRFVSHLEIDLTNNNL